MPLNFGASTMLFALAGVALLLVMLARLATPRRGLAARFDRRPLLSPWERKALGIFSTQLGPSHHLCAQVRLADMLSIQAADRGMHFRALNRVACKSVDFVVVDVVSGSPVLVIELDDKTHQREDRQARDAFVSEVLRQAGIPIVRFRPSQRLDIGPPLAAALAATRVAMKFAAE